MTDPTKLRPGDSWAASGSRTEWVEDGLLVGQTLPGQVRVDRLLASDALTATFIARRGAAPVVLRVLRAHGSDPRASLPTLARIRECFVLAQRLRHPGFTRVVNAGELPGGRAYFVSELRGGTSAATLAETGALRPEHLVVILDQLSEMMAEARSRGAKVRRPLLSELSLRPNAGTHFDLDVDPLAVVELLASHDPRKPPVAFSERGVYQSLGAEQRRGAPDENGIHPSDARTLGYLSFELLKVLGRPARVEPRAGSARRVPSVPPPVPPEAMRPMSPPTLPTAEPHQSSAGSALSPLRAVPLGPVRVRPARTAWAPWAGLLVCLALSAGLGVGWRLMSATPAVDATKAAWSGSAGKGKRSPREPDPMPAAGLPQAVDPPVVMESMSSRMRPSGAERRAARRRAVQRRQAAERRAERRRAERRRAERRRAAHSM